MKQRIITAAILIAIIAPILYLGGIVLEVALMLIGILGLKELFNLKKKEKNIPFYLEIMAYVMLIAFIYESSKVVNLLVDFRILLVLMISFLLPMLNNKDYEIEDAFFIIGSIFLLGSSFNILLNVRNLSLTYVIYLLIITIFTDSFALFTGMLVGKRKLNERVSPNKTVEGFIGGTFIATIVATIFYMTAIQNNPSILTVAIISAGLSVMGQLGDLVFSSIKRHFKVKDFGNLFPGHGGILDRLDSIIFVLMSFSLFIGVI